jgi:hypothetical protein
MAALLAARAVPAKSVTAAKTAPEEDLARRVEQVHAESKKLSEIEAPITTEPAFQFRA